MTTVPEMIREMRKLPPTASVIVVMQGGRRALVLRTDKLAEYSWPRAVWKGLRDSMAESPTTAAAEGGEDAEADA